MKLIITLIALTFSSISFAKYTINIMAPLTIGNLENPNKAHHEWTQFENNLQRVKEIGVDAISTDIWWGLVEKSEGQYNWAYYNKLISIIEKHNLKWVPILSFHQLGGNVGDEGYIPPPAWIWKKYIGREGVTDENSLKYKSEQGNYNSEYVSAWGTPFVVEDYRRFMIEFQKHFANKAHLIQEVNVSLGPAGELRYPSYNSHDQNSGYPTRGSLQSYSNLAINSFKKFARARFNNDINFLNKHWGFSLSSFDSVYPPSNLESFFSRREHFSNYGKDFFDWYNDSLVNHGRIVLNAAKEVFSAEFKSIPLGAKMPGIHWRIATDRLAELAAGLTRTSYSDWNSDQSGHGYYHTVKLLKEIPNTILHFTALEMDNGREGPLVGSEAKSLVFWMGDLAKKLEVDIKGENALAGELHSVRSWDNMADALIWGNYAGITILRLDPVLSSQTSIEGLIHLINLGVK